MLDPDVVQRVVRETHRRFDGHPTREFVPILVEDSARDRLRVTPVGRSRTGTAADTASLTCGCGPDALVERQPLRSCLG